MTSNNQINAARLSRVTVFTAVIAVQTILALHTSASAQVVSQFTAPARFVAPVITPVAALAGTPVATPAVAGSATRPAFLDETKHAAVLPAAPLPSSAIACSTPTQFTHLDHPLLRTMRTLASGEPLTIVAIGSSSTAGAGASSSDAAYPNRLAVELRQRFPDHAITVLNRGVNGEETENMMARFAADVFAAHPQLVIWQVGTNSVLRDRPLDKHSAELHEGIDELKATGADVVLIDVQYSPAVIVKSETLDMVDQIALTAKEKNVDLFHRFAAMRDWRENQHLSFDTFVSPDGLHMNDWGYGCMAKLLGSAIAEAATRPVASAAAAHPAH
jgi:lysophospholipase L1-like esterase